MRNNSNFSIPAVFGRWSTLIRAPSEMAGKYRVFYDATLFICSFLGGPHLTRFCGVIFPGQSLNKMRLVYKSKRFDLVRYVRTVRQLLFNRVLKWWYLKQCSSEKRYNASHNGDRQVNFKSRGGREPRSRHSLLIEASCGV